MSPTAGDIEANAGCAPWQSNRGSMNVDPRVMMDPTVRIGMNPGELEKALQSPSHLGDLSPSSSIPPSHKSNQGYIGSGLQTVPQRHPSVSKARVVEGSTASGVTPVSTRTRRALQQSTNPSQMYETPNEQDELLHEALQSASRAAKSMDHWTHAGESQRVAMAHKDVNQQSIRYPPVEQSSANPYPTPSPSAKGSGVPYNENLLAEPASPLSINRSQPKEDTAPKWPTPPYEENEWAAAAAASIFAAGSIYQ